MKRTPSLNLFTFLHIIIGNGSRRLLADGNSVKAPELLLSEGVEDAQLFLSQA